MARSPEAVSRSAGASASGGPPERRADRPVQDPRARRGSDRPEGASGAHAFPARSPASDWDYGTEPRLSQRAGRLLARRRSTGAPPNTGSTSSTSSRPPSTASTSTSSTSARSNPNALALAVTHGWPGSIVEFTKIIGPLTDPAAHGGNAETRSTSSRFRCPASASPASRPSAATVRSGSPASSRS